jgi:hypothetical protein
MQPEIAIPIFNRFTQQKPSLGHHEFRSLHMEGKTIVVLEGPLEASAFITFSGSLPIPFKRTYIEKHNQLRLTFTDSNTAEDFALRVRAILKHYGSTSDDSY